MGRESATRILDIILGVYENKGPPYIEGRTVGFPF